MAREFLTDEEVEVEIDRLRASDLVALARKEQRVKYQRRQVLYNLRNLEKRGGELAKAGITMEMLQSMAEEGVDE